MTDQPDTPQKMRHSLVVNEDNPIAKDKSWD
jgi:hypothetical protein